MKNLKNKLLPFIIAFSALAVSGSAAFYSVSGLSKLFAGASLEVIIMAGSLEVAKLVIASLLYQYWDTLNKILRTYLTIATIILVLITSMGIYGFLSAAYQETYSKLSITENKKEFIKKKLELYKGDVSNYDKELEGINKNISTLSNAKSTSIQIKDTSVKGGVRNTISTAELRLARERIKTEEANKKEVRTQRQVALDSVQKFELEILQLENTSDQAGELGPLKYLAELTGQPMGKIINWLLLIIIFVFDPLAISLVVAANFAFNQNRKSKPNYKINPVELEEKFSFEEFKEKVKEAQKKAGSVDFSKENAARDKILEKANLYEKLKSKKDPKSNPPVEEYNDVIFDYPNKPENVEDKMKETQNKLLNDPNVSAWRKNVIKKQRDKDEDLDKIY